jgi:hypothetical protein
LKFEWLNLPIRAYIRYYIFLLFVAFPCTNTTKLRAFSYCCFTYRFPVVRFLLLLQYIFASVLCLNYLRPLLPSHCQLWREIGRLQGQTLQVLLIPLFLYKDRSTAHNVSSEQVIQSASILLELATYTFSNVVYYEIREKEM